MYVGRKERKSTSGREDAAQGSRLLNQQIYRPIPRHGASAFGCSKLLDALTLRVGRPKARRLHSVGSTKMHDDNLSLRYCWTFLATHCNQTRPFDNHLVFSKQSKRIDC